MSKFVSIFLLGILFVLAVEGFQVEIHDAEDLGDAFRFVANECRGDYHEFGNFSCSWPPPIVAPIIPEQDWNIRGFWGCSNACRMIYYRSATYIATSITVKAYHYGENALLQIRIPDEDGNVLAEFIGSNEWKVHTFMIQDPTIATRVDIISNRSDKAFPVIDVISFEFLDVTGTTTAGTTPLTTTTPTTTTPTTTTPTTTTPTTTTPTTTTPTTTTPTTTPTTTTPTTTTPTTTTPTTTTPTTTTPTTTTPTTTTPTTTTPTTTTPTTTTPTTTTTRTTTTRTTTNSPTTTLNPDIVTCQNKTDGKHPHPYNCAMYIICAGEAVQETATCPIPLLFNPNISDCDFAVNVDCEISCSGKPDGMYAHPHDCALFIGCSGGHLDILKCPHPLLFDPYLIVCNYPEFVDCHLN